jgi:hypothetical protein
MMHCNSSVVITKRMGDIGSLYLTPLLQNKDLPRAPLRTTEVVAYWRIEVVHCNHWSLNPNCCIICRIQVCSIVSKALMKSSFKITISLLDCWHWCIYLKGQAKQSWMVLHLMNSYWFWWTRGIITDWILSPNNLVIIFTMQFIREIGMNSFIIVGLFTLGTKVMKELLIAWRSTTPLKKSYIVHKYHP